MAGEIVVHIGPAHVDVEKVHGWISGSYWAPGIPIELFRKSIEGSIPFSAFDGNVQVGFARVVTDCATFAWLADVWVDESLRGKGIGHALMNAVVEHPDLQQLRRFLLATRDAHSLYAQFGFKPIDKPEAYMAIRKTAESLYGERR